MPSGSQGRLFVSWIPNFTSHPMIVVFYVPQSTRRFLVFTRLLCLNPTRPRGRVYDGRAPPRQHLSHLSHSSRYIGGEQWAYRTLFLLLLLIIKIQSSGDIISITRSSHCDIFWSTFWQGMVSQIFYKSKWTIQSSPSQSPVVSSFNVSIIFRFLFLRFSNKISIL